MVGPTYLDLIAESQSPYGAMWFATRGASLENSSARQSSRNPLTGLCGLQPHRGHRPSRADLRVAIPLRGYVVCNQKASRALAPEPGRNPLTGLCGLQHDGKEDHQPYTPRGGRNPLTGLSGLQQGVIRIETADDVVVVAIPLRG